MGYVSKARKVVDFEGGWQISGTAVTTTAAELNKLSGNAVTAADLTKLNGITPTAAKLNNFVGGAGASYVIARGVASTVAASDDITTGLATVVAAFASLEDDPVDGCQFATAMVGNQAGAPAAGHILLKTWKAVDGDATLIAATTTGKKVSWLAIGTAA